VARQTARLPRNIALLGNPAAQSCEKARIQGDKASAV
jgi:hypothetical protein